MLSSNRNIKCRDINGVLTFRTTHDIAAECGFTWQESVTGVYAAENFSYADLLPVLEENAEKLVLTKLSEQVGYGVITDPQTSPIVARKVVSAYTGNAEHHQNDAYAMAKISAFKFGNMGRFFPHLETKLALLKYEFDQSVNIDDIATANMSIIFLDDHKSVPGLMTITTVMPGKIIGISYGPNYWECRSFPPKLFYTNGEIIDDKLYKTTEERKKYYELVIMMPSILGEIKEWDKAVNLITCSSAEEVNNIVKHTIMAKLANCKDEEQNKWNALSLMYCACLIEQTLLLKSGFNATNVPTDISQALMDCLPHTEDDYTVEMIEACHGKFTLLLNDTSFSEYFLAINSACELLNTIINNSKKRKAVIAENIAPHELSILNSLASLKGTYEWFMNAPYEDFTEEELSMVACYLRLTNCIDIFDSIALRISTANKLTLPCQQITEDDHYAAKVARKLTRTEMTSEVLYEVLNFIPDISANSKTISRESKPNKMVNLLKNFGFLCTKKNTDINEYLLNRCNHLQQLVAAYDNHLLLSQDDKNALQKQHQEFVQMTGVAIHDCLKLLGRTFTRLNNKGLADTYREDLLTFLGQCHQHNGQVDLTQIIELARAGISILSKHVPVATNSYSSAQQPL